MAYLYNNPSDFADELTAGFAAAYPRWVRQVPGGVVRAATPKPGTVAVITGGGSGHYPAFAGLVGPGMAHGAAMGNIFASPSAQQVHAVAKAAQAGGGVLLTYGNYAGDVLNFNQAQERLIAEGIRTVTVAVTDDISSAPASESHKRRGIAGDLAVFKVAGACADAGHDLDEVSRMAALANSRTRSFGIAFSGCTLPGSTAALFTVPEGKMAVGMGIHGEPGIREEDLPTADQAAELLVCSLLEEAVQEPRGSRVGLILNGLGAVKSEELFVVYRRIAELLEEAGITVVDPEIGEMVTSFQMAGVSLSLLWLNDELEHYWKAPASTPAYRKGAVEEADEAAVVPVTAQEPTREALPPSSETSRRVAARVHDILQAVKNVIDANVEELGRIDSVAGDGDHGIGMQRGAAAAVEAAAEALNRGAGARTLLVFSGDAWAHRAGGTSGALWGMILNTLGERLGDQDAPSAPAVAGAIRDAGRKIMEFGKAQLGDKTLVDVLVPFAEALGHEVAAGKPLSAAWSDAAVVAQESADATATLIPKMGRARPLAEKSLGTPDAGAVSMALIIRTVADRLTTKESIND
ncbi:dihydroxyacetone kinase family protein [Arthrobacter silvisoli]|uniref:dihydroxyacetone kinase family protein n=1 Tax=Arthrobacter silvisoli TaxID=2291022 RepID=UPI000E216BC0|nr:dihydroxyacetone kinase family protein [Arthrobacter silvisoli]